MYDLKWIREAPEEFDAVLRRRNFEPQSAKVLALDGQRRQAQTTLQELQARRNEISKQIGVLMHKGEDASAVMAEVAQIKSRFTALEEQDRELGHELLDLLGGLPNSLYDDVPDGNDEADNAEIRVVGDRPVLDFAPKQHFELGEALGGMDFDAAARLSGARFVVMRSGVARLHRAIGQFMLDLHVTEHGYTEVIPPYLVRDAALYGTGQLPKFGEDLFRTTNDHWMIPTAEVPLTNLVAEQILSEEALPLRFAALTPCFRSEAGSAGKDTRGMLRQHQFDKVEMVSVVHPDNSEAELERMTACAETVLQRLGLHYRVMKLCSGDTGFAARRTYDLEVWVPGQNTYREISSCSTCGDFQARRMKARFRPAQGKSTEFVHTLNGSGVAVGRALIAVMENGQQADGSIKIPAALRPYMGGLEVLTTND
jgi:seryl-tRNA synthetase|tara:strand:- start:3546 stop:4823 length:1278 start_codon:yes stop_codon:yes gene_type:complete